jgi:hypothetical protein
MTKPLKIAKARGRAVVEWIGKTPDAKVPAHVRLRILRRFEGKCYLTGILIADGQSFDLEDIRPLEEGGTCAANTISRLRAIRQAPARTKAGTPAAQNVRGREMTDEPITEDDFRSGSDAPVLGPHYFSSRRFAEEVMKDVETTFFADALKKFSDDLYSAVLEKTNDWLASDAESNVQSYIWRTVDQIVKGILSGDKWIVDRYALGSKYECGSIRTTLANHISKRLQDARIVDLEEEVARLKERIDCLRR